MTKIKNSKNLNKFIFLVLFCIFSSFSNYARNENLGRFIQSGVGGTYIVAIEKLFEIVNDYCQKENKYLILDSDILVFDVGTFKAVRAFFFCSDHRNGI